MSATFATLTSLDARLAQQGRPRIFAPGSWWATEAKRFYGHPTAREWWAQVGRGGAKSTVIYRIAENETIFGDWHPPRGERRWATIKSRNKDEASKGIGIISSDLEALGVRHAVSGDTIELLESPLGIRVTAASVGGTSGWRSYFDANDELAKWPRDGAMAVDAREVIASGRAMTVTDREARRLYFSSAFVVEGPHYEAIELGDTEHQVVSRAATWIANPSITEAQTHSLERDSRTHAREYASIAAPAASAAFDARLVERARGTRVPDDWRRHGGVVLIDASGGGSDAFVWCYAEWRPQLGGGQAVVEILDVDGVADAAKQGLTSDDVLKRIAELARRHSATEVVGDQGERFALQSAFSRLGLSFVSHAWSQTTKQEAATHFRGWLRDGRLALDRHEQLHRQLLAYEEKALASGGFRYAGRGNSHDDYASLALLAARADQAGNLRGSPTGALPPGAAWVIFRELEDAERAGGGPSALVVADPPEDRVELLLPERWAASPPSTFFARSGQPYRVESCRIRARQADLEDLLRAGFAHVVT